MASPTSKETASAVTVDFGSRFAESEPFDRIYQEGMRLIEETAAYLDGDGRHESAGLPQLVAVAYATESMRLTTRLMQLASWLLLQRAEKNREMSPDEIRFERGRIDLAELGAGAAIEGAEELPATLRDLVRRSLRLHERIVRLDAMLRDDTRTVPRPVPSPARERVDRLRDAFGTASE